MIVQDKLDPSGMFSKAGRLSLEMYTMLQEKDFILNNKRKMQLLSDIHIQQSMNSMQAKQKMGNEKHRTFQPRGSETTKSVPVLEQPFHKMISRDQYQQLQEKMTSNNSKFGMYNPKYHLIYEKSPLYPDLESLENKQRAREFQQQNLHYNQSAKKLKTNQQKKFQAQQLQQQMQSESQIMLNNKSIVASQLIQPGNMNSSQIIMQQQQNLSQSVVIPQGNNNINPNVNNSVLHQSSIQTAKNLNHSISESSILGIDFDKPHQRVVVPVAFDKQQGRKPMMSNSIPHDKRFEYLEIPEIYSKSKRLPNISFDTQKRDQKLFGSKTGGLDYNVNYELIHPRTSLGVLDYSKLSPRKSFSKPIYTLNERIGDDYLFSLARSKSQIMKKVTVPKFDKMPGRDRSLHENKLEQLDIDINHYKSRHQ